MTPVFAEIDVGQLLQVAWVSLVAGVGVALLYSLVILGTARASEERRAGHGNAAVLYTAMAVLALVAFLAGVAIGVNIMLSK